MAPLLHCHRSTPVVFRVAFVVINSMLSQFSLLPLVLIVSRKQFFLIPFFLLLLYVHLPSFLFPALLLTSRPLSPPFFSLPPSLPPHIFSFHFLYLLFLSILFFSVLFHDFFQSPLPLLFFSLLVLLRRMRRFFTILGLSFIHTFLLLKKVKSVFTW